VELVAIRTSSLLRCAGASPKTGIAASTVASVAMIKILFI
jgi:hypothetical protein